MKLKKTPFFILSLGMVALLALPALGEEAAPAPKNFISITPVQKCYAQLGPEEALDIQRNYSKPYQECQRRLTLKQKEQQTKKVGQKETENAEEPEKTLRFLRVQPVKPVNPKKDAAEEKR